MTGVSTQPDPRYIAARRALLDALEALEPHGKAVIVAGAQAVYMHTGAAEIGIAPYTTDGDLALDPALLVEAPELEAAMKDAGFQLWQPTGEHAEPGIWVTTVRVEDEDLVVPVDLIVPEGFAIGGGRRGARLGVHGRRAARRVVGLEAALVDHATHHVGSLDLSDKRAFDVEVAGTAALLVAKAHKIHDRLSAKADRAVDKDAVDVYRLMQSTSPADVAATLSALAVHDVAGNATNQAIQYFDELFANRSRPGIEMAVRGLRIAISEDEVVAFATGYAQRLLEEVVRDGSR